MKSADKTCATCGVSYSPGVLFCPTDGTPLSNKRSLSQPGDADPYLGLELPGQIRLEALVGIGSMGRVYRAFQSGVDRDVAVKILHRELTGKPDAITRFHREAKIASRLVHPNVVQVLLTGTLPTGEVYLVIEFLDGISLLSALAAQGDGGALPMARALHVTLQLCDAVGEAHAQGIVHRDLKPENIMLVRRGEDPDFVKVLDFGIARLDAPSEGNVTQAGLIFGTAKYISPEGAEGHPVGPPADVYAIATVLYQCLSGRTPFEADNPMTILLAQINQEPPQLRAHDRSSYVPDALAQVIVGNLAKKPEDRASDARAFGRELEQAAREAGIAVDTLGTASRSLRLASKQRTKQNAFSNDMKAAIAAADRPVTAFEEPTEHGSPAPLPNPPRPQSTPAPTDDPGGRPGGTQLSDDEHDTIHGADAELLGITSSRAVASRPEPTMPGEPLDDLRDSYLPERQSVPAPRASNPAVAVVPGLAPPAGSRPGLVSSPAVSPAASPASRTSAVSAPASGSSRPSGTVIDPDVTEEAAPSGAPAARPAGSHAPSPSDGVAEIESPPHPHRPTSRRWLLVAAVLVALPVLTFGVAKFWSERQVAATDSDSIESLLEQAGEAMEQRAWAEPAGNNVRELTDRALQLSPGDRRVLSLRRTAADRILADALAAKYAGKPKQALGLARLAVELNPEQTAASHLLGELTPAPQPTPAGSAGAGEPTDAPATSASPLAKSSGRPGGPLGTAQALGSAEAPASASPRPDLPPSPPPDLTPPPPSSSRPWL